MKKSLAVQVKRINADRLKLLKKSPERLIEPQTLSTANLEADDRSMENAHEHAQENPVSSLGIALASGFLVNRLLDSRVGMFHEKQP